MVILKCKLIKTKKPEWGFLKNNRTFWLSIVATLHLFIGQSHAVTQSRPINIVFDAGDVLVETKYIRSLFTIGIEKFAFHASTWNNPFDCHRKLFQFLDTIKPRTPNSIIILDPHGHILPQLMVDWLKGTITPQDLLEIIRQTKGSFTNWTEEALVRSLAEMIFTPETFVKTRQLIDEAVRFAKEAKQAGHKIYILSNWDPVSFTFMQEEYPEFFNLFDGIVLSGDIGLAKPEPAIFEYILNKYDLDPADTFFIDDQRENVEAARASGIYSVQYSKKRGLIKSYHDFDDVRQKFNNWLQLKNSALANY